MNKFDAQGDDGPIVLSSRDGIAEIHFNRPKALNAITCETAAMFRHAVDTAIHDVANRVILLTASGRAFIAGGDLAYFRAAERPSAAAREIIDHMHAAMQELMAAPQVVVASVQGAVAGAGFSIVLAADLAIAADDATFNMSYTKVANSPDCAATWMLPRIVGMRKALELSLLSETIDAAQAKQLGIVNRVVAASALPSAMQDLVRRLNEAAPLAMRSTKDLLRNSFDRSLPEQLLAEANHFASNADSVDFREALNAFFEKRSAIFVGR